MMDMSEEHYIIYEELYKNTDDYNVIEKSYEILDNIEDFQRRIIKDRYFGLEYTFDVFPLHGEKPEKVMKKIISEYYDKYGYWPPLSKKYEMVFFNNEFFGEKEHAESLEDYFISCFNSKGVEENQTFMEYLEHHDDLKKNYMDIIKSDSEKLRNMLGGKNIEFFHIPKECKGFYNYLLEKVYFMIFDASFVVFDNYVLLIMYGTSE